MAVELRDVDNFGLHRLDWLALAFAPDRPGMHLLRHMTQGRDLTDLVQILQGLGHRGTVHIFALQ